MHPGGGDNAPGRRGQCTAPLLPRKAAEQSEKICDQELNIFFLSTAVSEGSLLEVGGNVIN